MKICHLLGTHEGWGGLERSVVDLANWQSERHEVMVLGAPEILKRLRPAVGAGAVSVQLSRRHPRLLWQIRRHILGFRPDVVHAHASKAAALLKTVRCFLRRDFACIATLQNVQRARRIFSGYDRVIAVSRRAGASLTGVKHQVIWNAIPSNSVRPGVPDAADAPFLGEGRPVLAAFGRLVDAKGFDVLLRALAGLDCRLWIVGDGPLRAELEALAGELGMSGRVWFAGFRPDAERLMCRADLMVISSRREGFPFVFVEMLHLRRPVVSTRVAGVEDVLPEVWLCEPEDIAGLTDVIRRALDQLPALPQIFQPVFDLAVQELALEQTGLKIESLYRAALAEHGWDR